MANSVLPAQHAIPDIVNKIAQEAMIFAVMGTTGSGKSTFIQKASGRQDVPIGHELKSCIDEQDLSGSGVSNNHGRYFGAISL